MFEPPAAAPPAVTELISPVSGRLVDLSEVPDLLYSERLLGPGIAIEPRDGLITAPIAGTVRTCPGSHHAFYLEAGDGTEVLVHVGVDAHVLRGLGFLPLVEEGQSVHATQALCLVDLEYLRIAGLPTVCTVTVTRNGDRAEFTAPGGPAVGARTALGRIRERAGRGRERAGRGWERVGRDRERAGRERAWRDRERAGRGRADAGRGDDAAPGPPAGAPDVRGSRPR